MSEGTAHAFAPGRRLQSPWDGWFDGGDDRRGPPDDARAFRLGWAVVLGLLAVAIVLNALTVLADSPAAAAWKPWVLEGTSNLVLATLAWIPGLAAIRSRVLARRAGWLGLSALHLFAVAAFSGVHTEGMTALRRVVYAAMGEVYAPHGIVDRLIYEFRKDVLTYAIMVAIFALARQATRARAAPPSGSTFDIRAGARLIRTPVQDILAVTAAGNYVEFLLADGRRPLMRSTLGGVESELAEAGFVRTHRAWLVNPHQVTGLERQRSGDWTVELGAASAPLSRRYSEALARLRRP